MADKTETIGLAELLDLSIGSPEQGAVNFNLVKSVLQIIIGQLMSSDEHISIMFRGSSADVIRNLKDTSSTPAQSLDIEVRKVKTRDNPSTHKTNTKSAEIKKPTTHEANTKPNDISRCEESLQTPPKIDEKLKNIQCEIESLKLAQDDIQERFDQMSSQVNKLVNSIPKIPNEDQVQVTPLTVEDKFGDFLWRPHESGYRTEPSQSEKLGGRVWLYDKNEVLRRVVEPNPEQMAIEKMDKEQRKELITSKLEDMDLSSLYGRNRHSEAHDDPAYFNSDMFDDKGSLKPMYDATCFRNAYKEALKTYSSTTNSATTNQTASITTDAVNYSSYFTKEFSLENENEKDESLHTVPHQSKKSPINNKGERIGRNTTIEDSKDKTYDDTTTLHKTMPNDVQKYLFEESCTRETDKKLGNDTAVEVVISETFVLREDNLQEVGTERPLNALSFNKDKTPINNTINDANDNDTSLQPTTILKDKSMTGNEALIREESLNASEQKYDVQDEQVQTKKINQTDTCKTGKCAFQNSNPEPSQQTTNHQRSNNTEAQSEKDCGKIVPTNKSQQDEVVKPFKIILSPRKQELKHRGTREVERKNEDEDITEYSSNTFNYDRKESSNGRRNSNKENNEKLNTVLLDAVEEEEETVDSLHPKKLSFINADRDSSISSYQVYTKEKTFAELKKSLTSEEDPNTNIDDIAKHDNIPKDDQTPSDKIHKDGKPKNPRHPENLRKRENPSRNKYDKTTVEYSEDLLELEENIERQRDMIDKMKEQPLNRRSAKETRDMDSYTIQGNGFQGDSQGLEMKETTKFVEHSQKPKHLKSNKETMTVPNLLTNQSPDVRTSKEKWRQLKRFERTEEESGPENPNMKNNTDLQRRHNLTQAQNNHGLRLEREILMNNNNFDDLQSTKSDEQFRAVDETRKSILSKRSKRLHGSQANQDFQQTQILTHSSNNTFIVVQEMNDNSLEKLEAQGNQTGYSMKNEDKYRTIFEKKRALVQNSLGTKKDTETASHIGVNNRDQEMNTYKEIDLEEENDHQKASFQEKCSHYNSDNHNEEYFSQTDQLLMNRSLIDRDFVKTKSNYNHYENSREIKKVDQMSNIEIQPISFSYHNELKPKLNDLKDFVWQRQTNGQETIQHEEHINHRSNKQQLEERQHEFLEQRLDRDKNQQFSPDNCGRRPRKNEIKEFQTQQCDQETKLQEHGLNVRQERQQFDQLDKRFNKGNQQERRPDQNDGRESKHNDESEDRETRSILRNNLERQDISLRYFEKPKHNGKQDMWYEQTNGQQIKNEDLEDSWDIRKRLERPLGRCGQRPKDHGIIDALWQTEEDDQLIEESDNFDHKFNQEKSTAISPNCNKQRLKQVVMWQNHNENQETGKTAYDRRDSERLQGRSEHRARDGEIIVPMMKKQDIQITLKEYEHHTGNLQFNMKTQPDEHTKQKENQETERIDENGQRANMKMYLDRPPGRCGQRPKDYGIIDAIWQTQGEDRLMEQIDNLGHRYNIGNQQETSPIRLEKLAEQNGRIDHLAWQEQNDQEIKQNEKIKQKYTRKQLERPPGRCGQRPKQNERTSPKWNDEFNRQDSKNNRQTDHCQNMRKLGERPPGRCGKRPKANETRNITWEDQILETRNNEQQISQRTNQTHQLERPPGRHGQRSRHDETQLEHNGVETRTFHKLLVDDDLTTRDIMAHTFSFGKNSKSLNVLHFNSDYDRAASSSAAVSSDLLLNLQMGSVENLSAGHHRQKYGDHVRMDLVRIMSDLQNHLTAKGYDSVEKLTYDALDMIQRILVDVLMSRDNSVLSSQPQFQHTTPGGDTEAWTRLQDRLDNSEREIRILKDRVSQLQHGEKKRTNEMLTREAYDVIRRLQADVETIHRKLALHAETIDHNKLCSESLYDFIREMDYRKMDNKDLDNIKADMIDKLKDKLDVERFQIECVELMNAIEMAHKKVDVHRKFQILQSDIVNKILAMLPEKIQKTEFQELTDLKISEALNKLESKLKKMIERTEEGASGTKKPMLRDLQCISCNTGVVMRDQTDSFFLPPPLRSQDPLVPNNCKLINRYCGGSNTQITAAQKVRIASRGPHLGDSARRPPNMTQLMRMHDKAHTHEQQDPPPVFPDIVIRR
ncbi:hypothetical protein WDU94_008855 [Cyamophila willieti]